MTHGEQPTGMGDGPGGAAASPYPAHAPTSPLSQQALPATGAAALLRHRGDGAALTVC